MWVTLLTKPTFCFSWKVLPPFVRVGQGFWVYSILGYLISDKQFLCLKLGMKYSLTAYLGYKVYHGFLNFGLLHEFYTNFSRVQQLLLDSTTLNPPGQPCFLRKFMKSWFAQHSSGEWVTPLPGKTFLHINRASPTEKIAFVQRTQVLHSKLSKINIHRFYLIFIYFTQGYQNTLLVLWSSSFTPADPAF